MYHAPRPDWAPQWLDDHINYSLPILPTVIIIGIMVTTLIAYGIWTEYTIRKLRKRKK